MFVWLKRVAWGSTIAVASFFTVLCIIILSFRRFSSNLWSEINKYLSTLLSEGLGKSLSGSSVLNEVTRGLPRSFILVFGALLLGGSIGILIGMLFSSRGGKGKKTLQVFATTLPLSLPDVMIIMLLQILMVSMKNSGLPSLPVAGYKNIQHLILPILSLSIIPAFYTARTTFMMAADAYNEKFVLTSMAKGCKDTQIHWVHIWRRIRSGVIHSLYGLIPLIISNLLIIEKFFYYPGLSNNLFTSIKSGDTNLVMGLVVGLTFVYLSAAALIYLFKRLDSLFGGENR